MVITQKQITKYNLTSNITWLLVSPITDATSKYLCGSARLIKNWSQCNVLKIEPGTMSQSENNWTWDKAFMWYKLICNVERIFKFILVKNPCFSAQTQDARHQILVARRPAATVIFPDTLYSSSRGGSQKYSNNCKHHVVCKYLNYTDPEQQCI